MARRWVISYLDEIRAEGDYESTALRAVAGVLTGMRPARSRIRAESSPL